MFIDFNAYGTSLLQRSFKFGRSPERDSKVSEKSRRLLPNVEEPSPMVTFFKSNFGEQYISLRSNQEIHSFVGEITDVNKIKKLPSMTDPSRVVTGMVTA